MAFNLSLQWLLLVTLFVLWSPVQGDEWRANDNQVQRQKREAEPVFINDFRSQEHHGDVDFQTESADFHGADNLATLNDHRLDEIESGIDNSDDYDFDELNNDASGENVVRRASSFSHSFVGKRQAPSRFNGNQLKRIPVQMFARRAPHYTHSFVGKRSTDEGDDNDLSDTTRAENFLKNNYDEKPSSFVENFHKNNNFVRPESSIQFNEPSSIHSVKKREARIEKRASGFSHSFVGKRIPQFNDQFVERGEDDTSEGEDATLVKDVNEAGAGISMTPEDFWESVSSNNNEDLDVDTLESPEKRQRRTGQNRSNYMGKRPSFTHSFVGKRTPLFQSFGVGEDNGEDVEGVSSDEDENDQDESVYMKSFGFSETGNLDFDQGFDLDSPDRRQRRTAQSGDNYAGKRPSFSHSFVGKRAPGFGHNFVGKRAPGFGHNFVGKRAPGFGHNFVGKRAPGFGHNFVGKRAPGFGHNFVGKRAPRFGHSFVGKRAPGFGHSFVGKRAPGFGHNFVGKRAPSFGHSFVGKRAPGFGHNFVGKRAPGFGHNFVGKRAVELEHRIIVKRDADFDNSISDKEIDYSTDGVIVENESDELFPEISSQQMQASDKVENYVISKELNNDSSSELSEDKSLENVDKRAPRFGHSFVGKRAPRFGHSFVGKRTEGDDQNVVDERSPGFGHSFVGKRAPQFGHSFVGKRAPRFGHSFVGKRAPRFGHSFVGKRTEGDDQNVVDERSPGFGHSFVGKRAPRFGHSFVGKRAPRFGHSFVGKRDNIDTFSDETSLEDTIGPVEISDLVKLMQNEGNIVTLDGERARILKSIEKTRF